MCGGLRSIAARSDDVVSPVLTAAGLRGEIGNAAPRFREILVDVRAERLQRRYVEDADFIGKWMLQTFTHEVVDGAEKGRQRLAGSGRRGNQRVTAGANGLPAAQLRGSRRA